MTAQERSRIQRSGRARYRWVAGLVAMLAGMLGLTAVARPAFAVNPMADLSVVAPPSFQPGDTHNVVVKLDSMSTGLGDSIAVTLTISNATESATLDFEVLKVTIGSTYCPNPTNDGFTCTFPYDGSPNLTVTFTIKNDTDNVPTGGATTFDKSLITVNDMSSVSSTTSLSQYFSLTLRGPTPNTTISGETDDITTGKPVTGALVSLHDSAHPAHSYSTHTDSQGRFSFPVDATHPVVAGQVFASATKNGFKAHSGRSMTFTPGSPISGWKVLVTPIVAATPTASTSISASATAVASPLTQPRGAAASGAPSGLGFGTAAGAALASSGGSHLFTYILIGGLILILIATGIMVTMLIRWRGRADGGDRAGGGPAGGGPDGGGPPRPAYDPGYAAPGSGYGQGGAYGEDGAYGQGSGLPQTRNYPSPPYTYDDAGRQ